VSLLWLILLPFIGGFFCWLVEFTHKGTNIPRWIALVTMLCQFALALTLWHNYDFNLMLPGEGSWALDYQIPWIPSFGISIHLAMDGMSMLMVVLTSFLGILGVICSWKEIQERVGFFHLNLLWIIAAVIGVFLAIDLFLFFFFWEMMLVPMFFLIAVWGHAGSDGRSRISAAIKFFIYTQASGLMMLLSILGLVFIHYRATGIFSFDYATLLHTEMSSTVEMILMLGFFIAFAVKMPMLPLHGWLPDTHSQAPTAGSVDLAGLLLKTAAYGLIRFGIPFFPHASATFAPIAMTLGLISIFYAALIAFRQTDIKRLIAYSSISHMGFVVIAIYVGTATAIQGAIVQMIAHGLSAAALFIMSGQLYERLHTRDLREMGGLWHRLRYLPGMMMLFSVASLGLPGTGNFIGEFMMLVGSFGTVPYIIMLATAGLVFGSVYSLAVLQRSCFGPGKAATMLRSLSAREYLMLLVLAVLLVALGVYPHPVLEASKMVGTLVQTSGISTVTGQL
jgi:NADH-quinone oxidoreductase subunit M